MIRRLVKGCLCNGPSSGPSIWLEFDEKTSTFNAVVEDMVCSICHTPWKRCAKGTKKTTKPLEENS